MFHDSFTFLHKIISGILPNSYLYIIHPSLYISSPFVLGFIFTIQIQVRAITSPSNNSSHKEGIPCGSFELEQDLHHLIYLVTFSRNEQMHRLWEIRKNVSSKRQFIKCLSILSYTRSSYILLGLSYS
uniref:Uncharacterized protein n=1 Tax=Lactuca sativa TaxID=4236 RepID=A0A9R1UHB8_LACSA|nr:hypothetical protein LSAT_V11C900479630 [Lactuca sativa]